MVRIFRNTFWNIIYGSCILGLLKSLHKKTTNYNFINISNTIFYNNNMRTIKLRNKYSGEQLEVVDDVITSVYGNKFIPIAGAKCSMLHSDFIKTMFFVPENTNIHNEFKEQKLNYCVKCGEIIVGENEFEFHVANKH